NLRDGLLSAAVQAGVRMSRGKAVLDEVAPVLDRIKLTTTPSSLLYALAPDEGDLLPAWWNFLRGRSPSPLPSAILARLGGWFEQGKPDREFDALLDEVERAPALIVPDEKDRWRVRLARTCVLVGKPKKAEQILRAAARAVNSAAGYARLGDFY